MSEINEGAHRFFCWLKRQFGWAAPFALMILAADVIILPAPLLSPFPFQCYLLDCDGHSYRGAVLAGVPFLLEVREGASAPQA